MNWSFAISVGTDETMPLAMSEACPRRSHRRQTVFPIADVDALPASVSAAGKSSRSPARRAFATQRRMARCAPAPRSPSSSSTCASVSELCPAIRCAPSSSPEPDRLLEFRNRARDRLAVLPFEQPVALVQFRFVASRRCGARFGQRRIEQLSRLGGSAQRDQGLDLAGVDEQRVLDIGLRFANFKASSKYLSAFSYSPHATIPCPTSAFVAHKRANVVEFACALNRANICRAWRP
jgi:hypothetical protein